MKKIILSGFFVLAIAALAAFNVNVSISDGQLSSLGLANVEALAESGEGPGQPYWGTSATCSGTTTIETYTTSETGWSWSASTNAWFFKGEISKKSPSSSTKETTTVTSSWTGCKSQGATQCTAPSC